MLTLNGSRAVRLAKQTRKRAIGTSVVLIALLTGQSTNAQSDAGESLPIRVSSLSEAVTAAVVRHPSIPAAAARVNQQAEQIDVARSQYLPQLRAGADLGNGWDEDRYRQFMSISLSQTVYDFGRIANSIDSARAGTEVERAFLDHEVSELALEVARAYVEILRHEALLITLDAKLQGIASIGSLAQQRRNLGAGNGSDEIQARSREEAARAEQLGLQSRLQRWRSILASLVQTPVARELRDDLSQLQSYRCSAENDSLADAAQLRLAEAERYEAETMLERARVSRWPTISLETGVRKPVFDNRFDSGDYDYNVALRVSVDLYQGGGVSARSRSAGHALRSAERSIDLARLQLLQQLEESAIHIEMLGQRESILAAQQESARQTRELYQEQYLSLGTRSLLDLLNAEQEMHMARYERENIRFEEALFKLDCMSAAGDLSRHFAIDVDTIVNSSSGRVP